MPDPQKLAQARALVGYQIARRGIQPIHQIAETARRIRSTHLEERIVPDRGEREMQFAGALREQLRFLGVNTAHQFFDQRAGWRGFIL